MRCLLKTSWFSPLLLALTVGATQASPKPASGSDSADTSPAASPVSINQLSDVQPSDWAYQALQSLTQRYGCVAGYPNGAFLGGRSLTRQEFAAGLNACLEKVSEATANKADVEVLNLLANEFQAELSVRRQVVKEQLEDRTQMLENLQFSTTTKLKGEVMINVGGITGGQDTSVYGNYRNLERLDAQLRSLLQGGSPLRLEGLR